MGTTELIIVFAALMALIAMVTIGIDWIGRPLKHRRFIPRMYRFEEEKLPVDRYGHPTLAPPVPGAPTVAPMMPPAAYAPTMPAPGVTPPLQSGEPEHYAQPAPVVVARVEDASSPEQVDASLAAASTSAFSDSLQNDAPTETAPAAASLGSDWLGSNPPDDPDEWSTHLPLDAPVKGVKPTLATKAERFWKATAAHLDDSHFDFENIERMRAGKAPRRTSPRTRRPESMQLTGLRTASTRDQVHMRWPGNSTDPWASS